MSPLPVLWQEYVGHDNNRDGYMLNMLESREVTKATLETQPLVFYTQHQTGAVSRAASICRRSPTRFRATCIR